VQIFSIQHIEKNILSIERIRVNNWN